MNVQRRKAIEKILGQVEDLKMEIENIMDEEQEAYDNLPESLQDSERGTKMQDAIEHLNDADNSIGDVIDYLYEIFE